MRTALDEIGIHGIREILNKGWMTHDAMWFYHCLQECGIEMTNRINTAAVRSMAAIEIRRICRMLGMEGTRIDCFDDLVIILKAGLAIIKADFIHIDYSFPEANLIRWETRQCFAHDGITRIGAISGYQCGIFERIKAWLEGLGVRSVFSPAIEGCLMHTHGLCRGEIRVDL